MTQEVVTLSETAPVALPAQSGSGVGFAVLDTVPTGVAAGSPPIITQSPAPGTPLKRNDLVTIRVTDPTVIRRAELYVTLGSDTFVVHDGDAFRGRFTNFSTRVAIADGFEFETRPNGGWVDSPQFEVHAVDTDGNEA